MFSLFSSFITQCPHTRRKKGIRTRRVPLGVFRGFKRKKDFIFFLSSSFMCFRKRILFTTNWQRLFEAFPAIWVDVLILELFFFPTLWLAPETFILCNEKQKQQYNPKFARHFYETIAQHRTNKSLEVDVRGHRWCAPDGRLSIWALIIWTHRKTANSLRRLGKATFFV